MCVHVIFRLFEYIWSTYGLKVHSTPPPPITHNLYPHTHLSVIRAKSKAIFVPTTESLPPP